MGGKTVGFRSILVLLPLFVLCGFGGVSFCYVTYYLFIINDVGAGVVYCGIEIICIALSMVYVYFIFLDPTISKKIRKWISNQ